MLKKNSFHNLLCLYFVYLIFLNLKCSSIHSLNFLEKYISKFVITYIIYEKNINLIINATSVRITTIIAIIAYYYRRITILRNEKRYIINAIIEILNTKRYHKY